MPRPELHSHAAEEGSQGWNVIEYEARSNPRSRDLVNTQLFESYQAIFHAGFVQSRAFQQTDEGFWLRQNEITEHGKTCRDTTSRGVREQRHVQHACFPVAF